jgi:enoyl-CoA hydratase/carnithine racemase
LHRAKGTRHQLRDVQNPESLERFSRHADLFRLRSPHVSTSRTLFTVEGAVAFLTFNRPEARNAMTWDMYEALVEACDRVDQTEAVRVFVLRAEGKAFIAGTDISQFTRFESRDDAIAYERRIDSIIDRLERVSAATLAQVQGVAAGGGCAIALACDLRVCTPDAQFGIPIARTLGNCLSAANYARLLDMIGPSRVKDLLFTGRLIDATEAASLGLVTRMADPSTIDDAVRDLTATIAANAPLTIRATKEAVRRIQASQRIDAAQADDLIAMCYSSGDFKEGVAAFLAKRPPVFKGR